MLPMIKQIAQKIVDPRKRIRDTSPILWINNNQEARLRVKLVDRRKEKNRSEPEAGTFCLRNLSKECSVDEVDSTYENVNFIAGIQA